MSNISRVFFDRFGAFYRWVTANPLWEESLQEMARHFPPSAAEMTLLDVGCGPGNSAIMLHDLRPDLRIIGLDISTNMLRLARHASAEKRIPAIWVQADITRMSIPNSSIDAIMGHSVYYLLKDRAVFLHEAMRVLRPGGRLILLDPLARCYPFEMITRLFREPRVALSVMGWYAMSRVHGRFTLEQIAAELTKAGFARVLTERAIRGYGVLSRGEKPFAGGLVTVDRIAQVASNSTSSSDFGEGESIAGMVSADLPLAIRGKFVFLLVEQTPNKPAWALKPGEVIRWEAARVGGKCNGGKPYLLVFTSLPKAVQFMQPAVMSGFMVGINKVAKFDKGKAPAWRADVLLNPDFGMLRARDYDFRVQRLPVDPGSAVTGEE